MPRSNSTPRDPERLYSAIRTWRADEASIAENTGFTRESIRKIKLHLFFERHWLDRYVEQGIPATYKRFDPDLDQADSWARLTDGSFTAKDLALLRHETAEACHMRNIDRSYDAAHNAAQVLYPAPEW